jgi:hypothetical protein
MANVTLSRWTMSYFALALVCLLAAEGLMASGFGFPAAPIQAPDTLVVVHLVAIGWLSLLMCGALFQFVPVLVARPIYSNFLPLPTLVCLVVGLCALLHGFLHLGGRLAADDRLLPAAGALLGLGFALALWNLGRTLWAARPLILPARFVVAGLFSLAATVGLGIVFTLTLGGAAAVPLFSDLTAAGVPIHAIAGLGGWLTFTAVGVSYRLLAMFMLAPELDKATSRGAFYCGTAALSVAIVGGIIAIGYGADQTVALSVSGLLGLAALGLYWHDVTQLYRLRRRRVIELNARMARLAFASLIAATALGIGQVATHAPDRYIAASVFLLAFGWLSGLGLAKLYKIVAFLTWLECYGPVLGKTATPRVQDLVVERRAFKWFALYFAATWLCTLCLILDLATGFRLGAAAMALATLGIAAQLIRIRRLADVAGALRLPAGAQRPRLLVSIGQHS